MLLHASRTSGGVRALWESNSCGSTTPIQALLKIPEMLTAKMDPTKVTLPGLKPVGSEALDIRIPPLSRNRAEDYDIEPSVGEPSGVIAMERDAFLRELEDGGQVERGEEHERKGKGQGRPHDNAASASTARVVAWYLSWNARWGCSRRKLEMARGYRHTERPCRPPTISTAPGGFPNVVNVIIGDLSERGEGLQGVFGFARRFRVTDRAWAGRCGSNPAARSATL